MGHEIADIRGPRIDARKALLGFASLLGSGFVSAVGFVVIASNRWVAFDSGTAVFIILFAQWQTLGLTISKMGVEQVAFALATENENAYLDPGKYVLRRVLPVAALFSVAVLVVFSPLAAVVAFATIVLDSYSLIVVADLNARERFATAAVSNLLNYPLFFAAVLVAHRCGRLTLAATLAAFLASSLIRALWLRGNRVVGAGMAEADCRANTGMALQQGLNYVLFRADQIALAVIGLNVEARDVGMYVFLAKFPETVAGIAVVAGAVLFPKIYIRYPLDLRKLLAAAAGSCGWVCAYAAAVVAAVFLYARFWKGPAIPVLLLVPFAVHALCIVLVNNITYSSLRQGYLPRLLLNLGFAAAAGLLALLPLCSGFTPAKLSWVVPLQLLAFVAASFLFTWGGRKELYG